jgi:serine/threonine protein kinase
MMNQHYCIRCGNPYSAPDPGTGLCPDCTRLLSQGKPASPTPEPPAHHPPSEIPDWQSGQVLLDTYEVKKLLGEGGMGKVYRVHHKSWDIDLAVKRPKPEIFSKAKGKENFIREAETWIELGLHPHIATCYYVRSMDDIPTLFAECVEGGSLESWIVESKKLYEGGVEKALERILDIAIQFAWG